MHQSLAMGNAVDFSILLLYIMHIFMINIVLTCISYLELIKHNVIIAPLTKFKYLTICS